MRSTRPIRLAIAGLFLLTTTSPIFADVVVLVNRTREPIEILATTTIASPQRLVLEAEELVTLPMRGSMELAYEEVQPVRHDLLANSAYYFWKEPGQPLALREIDLRHDSRTRGGRDLGNRSQWEEVTAIPVKILVDQAEPARRRSWERRLRERVEAASEILSRWFRIRFEVVAADTWTSQEPPVTFETLLREFEQQVDPEPARLAIGFTSRRRATPQDRRMGGTYAPLHSHILIREWNPQMTESDRLEVLVHELGHFLGAAHSPEPDSVMRQMLGEGPLRRGSPDIRFDPINALAVSLWAEEIRFRKIDSISELTPETALRLTQVYGVLAEVFPEDRAAARFVQLLTSQVPLPPPLKEPDPGPVRSPAARDWPVAATRFLLLRLSTVAGQNAARAPAAAESAESARREPQMREVMIPLLQAAAESAESARREGDELTALYVRALAGAAGELPPDVAAPAFLLALGIGLDSSDLLWRHPLLAEFTQAVETAEERDRRLQRLGAPTVHQRRDLAQHFAVSAFLTAAYGPHISETAGVAKEILDARGGTGFSFADLAANHAGIRFANHVLDQTLTLSHIAATFRVADFLPPIDGLPEGLTWQQFQEQYHSPAADRYRQLREKILERIAELPGYDG